MAFNTAMFAAGDLRGRRASWTLILPGRRPARPSRLPLATLRHRGLLIGRGLPPRAVLCDHDRDGRSPAGLRRGGGLGQVGDLANACFALVAVTTSWGLPSGAPAWLLWPCWAGSCFSPTRFLYAGRPPALRESRTGQAFTELVVARGRGGSRGADRLSSPRCAARSRSPRSTSGSPTTTAPSRTRARRGRPCRRGRRALVDAVAGSGVWMETVVPRHLRATSTSRRSWTG